MSVEGTSVATFSLDSSSLLLSPAPISPPPHWACCLCFSRLGPPSYNGPRTPSPPTSSDHPTCTTTSPPDTHPRWLRCMLFVPRRCKPEAPSLARGVLVASNNVCPIHVCMDSMTRTRLSRDVCCTSFSRGVLDARAQNMQSLLAPDPQHMVTRGR